MRVRRSVYLSRTVRARRALRVSTELSCDRAALRTARDALAAPAFRKSRSAASKVSTVSSGRSQRAAWCDARDARVARDPRELNTPREQRRHDCSGSGLSALGDIKARRPRAGYRTRERACTQRRRFRLDKSRQEMRTCGLRDLVIERAVEAALYHRLAQAPRPSRRRLPSVR